LGRPDPYSQNSLAINLASFAKYSKEPKQTSHDPSHTVYAKSCPDSTNGGAFRVYM
jgi:hypothetical protein